MRVFKYLSVFSYAILITACSNKQPSNSDIIELPKKAPKFADFSDVNEKKKAFFHYMFAFVVHANLDIKKEREFILAIEFDEKSLNKKQKKQLTAICEKYSNTCEDLYRADLKVELLNEVNYVPAGLALAQSANESSWGTSRFSKKGNNYFGQWCYQKGCGIVPNSRNEDANHEVRKFESTLDSVVGYMFNINTHSAYADLREKREQLKGNQLDSNLLAQGLIRYSERGEEYVDEIQSMIRINKLTEYDQRLMEYLK
ncbi:glucosaminidase domain-containing protein [Marinicellulosiphila megalodicopiae]|uniref:glucosaminidase domain-containing protein n=1 Tax=Marinicellulosiphila megalodicopiae TaxID=2724896 RepID=UPI003BB05C73